MGLSINANQFNTGINNNFFSNPIGHKRVGFVNVNAAKRPDSVTLNTDLSMYASEKAIRKMIKANPKIMKILNEAQIPLRINMETLNHLSKNHLPQTKKVALGIIDHLPAEFKSAVNVQAVLRAAILHDFGKVLIPANVFNKQGKFTDKEFNIMQKHAQLGYELLKTTDLDNETLELIKNHHQNAQKTGYPEVEELFVSDINSQILSTADVYRALREKRPYKAKIGKNQALKIIHQDVKDGKIHPKVFKALVDFANREENLAEIHKERQLVNN